ncbi:MAG: PilZ domain-containing protein [Candidatus Gastranaerophilales bacterium]|nr:PilZ domain-containing protein [Candidatus Gastranaerophilales bacterium]
MNNILEAIKDVKIIPNNFKSSGELEIIKVEDEKIFAKLILLEDSEVQDYPVGSNVEVFGVNSVGLIYFETKIIDKNDLNIVLAQTEEYSIIQRREYSRVSLNSGKVYFKDNAPDFVQQVKNISAGGVKLIVNSALDFDKKYDIQIELSNNMKIDCTFQPIRIEKSTECPDKFLVSGKFSYIENSDRITLVQYAFKVKMEEQSKKDE